VEANCHSTNEEIPRFLWNPKVQYRVNKSSPGSLCNISYEADLNGDKLLTILPTTKIEDRISICIT